MALMDLKAPYVHSNIYNFHSQIEGSFLDTRTVHGQKRLNKQITEIQHLRNQLKSAADDFLGGLTPQQASNQLLNNPRTYSKIALEILRSEKMRQSLIIGNQYNIQSVKNFFSNNNKLQNRLIEIINTNDLATISAEALADEIMESMGGYQIFLNLSGEQQRQELGKVFTGKAAEKRIREKMKRKARSETGKIKQVIISLIKESALRTTKANSLDQSFSYFSRTFLDKVREEKIVYQNGQTPQDYLNSVRQNIVGLRDYKDRSNAAGALGEEWLRAVTISDTAVGFDIEVVGGGNEEGAILKDLERMVTHHKLSAQSQTDLIITNSINQKKARVQAKNYMDVLNKIITLDKNIPLLAKIQEETGFLKLLQRLKGTPGGISLSDNDLRGIAYLVANELWFNMKGSYGERRGRNLTSTTGGLSYVIQQINNLMTNALVNFIGVTIDESLTVHSEASNIFFLFSNSVLIPTYMLLDGIIAQLKNYEKQIASLKVTLKRSGIKWAYSNAKKFHDAKRDSVDRLDLSRNYQDEALVAVGRAQGQNIMSSLNISRVNLKIDLHTLLTSAWSFK